MRPTPQASPRPASARFLLLLGGSLIALAAPAAADGPSGGVAVRGKAAISQTAARTTIRQRSNRAVIDWAGFDVGRGHTVVFDQPGRRAATLNRVDSAKRSVIEGAIEAPGTVVIQNRAGVIFTETSRIDTGGLVAASQDVDAGRFIRDGRLVIGGGETAGARMVNAGRITVREAGLAALVGSEVENAGEIVARRGVAALASGAKTTIDFAGDGVVRFAVDGDAPGDARGVDNRGLIDVGGGRVLISAGAAARTLDAAINTTGVIRAASGAGDGGRVELVARGAGEVRIGGAIDVSGARSGGAVTATGTGIAVTSAARIDARGGRDGGAVRLGGDRHGEGPLRRADTLRVDAGATIAADGAVGRGGEVVLWSEGATLFDGAISATGPVRGGFVETSGRYALDVGADGSVDVGAGGDWLLDPRDIIIGTGGLSPVPPGTTAPPPGAAPYAISRLAIVSTLNGGGDVTITTVQPGATMAGDITVAGPLTWTGDGNLRLEAERDITLTAAMNTGRGDFTAVAARNVTSSGVITVGDGDFTLDAGAKTLVNQNIRATGAGAVSLRARTGDVEITQAPANNVIVSTTTGALSLTADEGAVRLKRVNASAGANVQVFSASGPVDVTAGTQILLDGGFQGGRWVRLGSSGSASDLTLAAPDIKVRGGGVGNTFAEVVAGPGGSITMDADLIRVLNGEGDQGRIQTFGGASLTLRGERQIWDGPVRAGLGNDNGGEVVIAGAVIAGFQPQFSLAPGYGFTFLPQAPGGTASRYDSSQPFVVTTSGTGTIDIDAPVVAQQITLETEERVGLGPGGRLTATGPGNALVVAAGRRFRNASDAGAAALEVADPDARWLLYLDAFAGLTGPAPDPREFDLYGRTYAGASPPALGFAGDRIVYAERPTLTLTGETLTKTYGVAAAPGYSVTGLRAGDRLGNALAAGPAAASAGGAAAADVGVYATVVAAEASEQGYVVDLVDGALTVDPAGLTVTAADRTRTYGAANPAFGARFDGFVLGQDASDLGGALNLTTTAGAGSDAGTYAIRADGLTSGNYAIDYADGALTVTPAQLTVTAADATRTYGAANPAFGARFDGFVLGQDASDLGGRLTLDADATIRSDVGTYAIAAGGLRSGNYAIAYVDGALRVNPAQLTVTPGGARTYGGADADFDATFDGFVLGQDAADLDGDLVYATSATAGSDVGAYALTASGLDGSNYAISYVEGTLVIDPARLTVTAVDKTRTYGAANPALSARFDGFVLGQDASDLDGGLTLGTAAAPSSDVGTYAITAGGLTSGNYAIAYRDGALTVNPARLTVTANDARRSYGAANPALGARFDGFVLGQDAADLEGSLTLRTAATVRSDVGTYAIAAGGLSSGNYAIRYAGGALTIDPARLTVTAADKTRTYGAANPALSARFDGFVLGQEASDLDGALRLTTRASATSEVGTYRVAVGGLRSGNYAITYVDGALTVDPAQLTVTPRGSRTYGEARTDFDADIDGFVLGEGLDDVGGRLAYDTPATVSSDAGTYGLTARGLRSGNYAIAYADGALTIDPAPLTVTANDARRSYGAANPAFGARFDGFVLGQDAGDLAGALTLGARATVASGVGEYAITAGGLRSGNYAIAYVDGALTVDPARLTVTPRGRRTYGDADADYAASFDGFVLGQGRDDLDGALVYATDAAIDSDVGPYRLTVTGLESGNYAIAYAEGALTIDPARLTVTANDAARVEGEDNPRFTARFDGFVLGQDASALGGELVFAADATPASGPGDYAITPGGLASGNYVIGYADGALTVTPAGAPTPGPTGDLTGIDGSLDEFGRGAPPFTPGDSAFRTTNAEAPTALDSTFELTYSLGAIAQPVAPTAAPDGGDTGGFTPAAGGAAPAAPAANAGCGPIATDAPADACVRELAPESYWTTAFPERAR